MTPEQMEAYCRAMEAWLTALHEDLHMRMSVFTLPAPPKVGDFK